MKIKIQKKRPDAIIPTKPDSGSGAYDLYCLQGVAIPPHTVVQIPIGIAFEIPQGYGGIIYDRSGMGRKGYNRHGGFIDASYRGEVSVLINNTTTDIRYIQTGDRVAQIAFQKVEEVEFEEVDELSETERGEKGFNSSGN